MSPHRPVRQHSAAPEIGIDHSESTRSSKPGEVAIQPSESGLPSRDAEADAGAQACGDVGSITFWMYNYAPQWEATSKDVSLLADACSPLATTRIVGLNSRGKLFGRDQRAVYVPAPLGVIASPAFRWLSAAGVNHVFASAGERFLLASLKPERTLLTVGKAPPPLPAIERNLPKLHRLRYVAVESERDREILRQGGVPGAALKLVYPGVGVRPYRPAQGPFTVLFATSPLGSSSLLERGVHLMVHAARQLPEVRFLLIWRRYHFAALKALLDRAAVPNVEVRNGIIDDMDAVYDSVHATILPGLEYGSLKPTPQSALLSLAHGKPVLASTPTSIASVVRRNRCGVVFEPEVGALRTALLELRENYGSYQANCHRTIRSEFSAEVFVERYQQLYRTMG